MAKSKIIKFKQKKFAVKPHDQELYALTEGKTISEKLLILNESIKRRKA